MSAALAEGLLVLFERLLNRLRPTTDRAMGWLRDTATPPASLEFRASDGALYTGLVVLERSRAILMLAVRSGQAPATSPAFQPAYRSPATPSPAPAYQPRLRTFEDEDPGDGWPADDPFMPRR